MRIKLLPAYNCRSVRWASSELHVIKFHIPSISLNLIKISFHASNLSVGPSAAFWAVSSTRHDRCVIAACRHNECRHVTASVSAWLLLLPLQLGMARQLLMMIMLRMLRSEASPASRCTCRRLQRSLPGQFTCARR